MIRTEALTRLRLLVGAMRPPLVAGARDRELPPLQPGQAIQARVEQQTPSGQHVVNVGGRVFEFRLPEGTRPGDFLRLVYINSEPRPTFALLRVERSVDQPDARLSDAGKLLSSLRALQDPGTETPASRPQSAAAILPADFPEVPQAAVLLRDSFSLSGLFYESHQAQWVMGSRTIAQLEQEPQGKLPPLAPQPEPRMAAVATADAPDLVQVPPEPAELVAPAPNAESGLARDAEGTPQRLPAHPDSFPLIRQQLAALETGIVAWRGEVWPGQDMEWEIGEAPDPEHPEAQPAWRTELRLALPRLGEVRARLEFLRSGMRLQILADSESHRAELAGAGDALASAFAARNLPLAGLEVKLHGA